MNTSEEEGSATLHSLIRHDADCCTRIRHELDTHHEVCDGQCS